MQIELSPEADKLICVLYKEFMEQRKNNVSRADAKTFGSSTDIFAKLMSKYKWSVQNVDKYCRELDKSELLYCKCVNGKVWMSNLSDAAITYIENRFNNGYDEFLEYFEKSFS